MKIKIKTLEQLLEQGYEINSNSSEARYLSKNPNGPALTLEETQFCGKEVDVYLWENFEYKYRSLRGWSFSEDMVDKGIKRQLPDWF